MLEDASVKLSSVASDDIGVSDRAMMVASMQGTTDPAVPPSGKRSSARSSPLCAPPWAASLRRAIGTAYALKQIITSGVRVFFYLENRERTLDSPTDKLMLSVTAFADELEREKARQRT